MYQSLKQQYSLPVYQTHYLNPQNLQERMNRGNSKTFHIHVSQELIPILERVIASKEWKIITLVRDPIARNISSFFEENMMGLYDPHFYERYRQGQAQISDFIQTFFDKYPHYLPLRWFDLEIKAVFNIDVFQDPFDFERQYQMQKR